MAVAAISLHTKNIPHPYPSPSKLKRWINQVVTTEGGQIHALSFILCTDDYLAGLNKKYLKHDTLTDIITFPYSNNIQELEADIYISYDRINENASSLKVELEEELKRVMVHGVLHLLGYGDKDKKSKALITKMENQYLKDF